MPNNVVKTPEDERLWEKAKGLAAKQGQTENYAYIMGIYKNMNPRMKSSNKVKIEYNNVKDVPAIDHGHDQPLSGGTDVMKRLQDQLLIEQGSKPREKNPRLAYMTEGREIAQPPLAALLSALRAQHWLYWTIHWQTKGPSFYGDHLLFQRLYSGLEEEIDTLAEKMVGYFDRDSVNAIAQLEATSLWIENWFAERSDIDRALKSEETLQEMLKEAYDTLKESGQLTLGLDDFLMAVANSHETNQYLLQQSVGNLKQASVRQVLKASRGLK